MCACVLSAFRGPPQCVVDGPGPGPVSKSYFDHPRNGKLTEVSCPLSISGHGCGPLIVCVFIHLVFRVFADVCLDDQSGLGSTITLSFFDFLDGLVL